MAEACCSLVSHVVVLGVIGIYLLHFLRYGSQAPSSNRPFHVGLKVGTSITLGIIVERLHESIAQVSVFPRLPDGKCAFGGGEIGEASCEE
jgi:hypothetical protein